MGKKEKLVYFCNECGYESPKWLGKCPQCEAWSSFAEEVVKGSTKAPRSKLTVNKPEILLSGNDVEDFPRILTNISEFDQTIGGGIVPGSVLLVGGDPGVGKSTLMLQLMDRISPEFDVLYVSGEESKKQVLMRAKRLGIQNKKIAFSNITVLENILDFINELKPAIVVIDSIQTIYSDEVDALPGNVSQIKSCSSALMRTAKDNSVAVFLIGHVTKEGFIAGPKILEHMVDTVIYFEGDGNYDFRVLRSVKNRFGSVNEIGLFRMTGNGLNAVENQSELFLDDSAVAQSGNAVAAVLEGNRTFLVQVQALVTKTQFGTPQRTATGVDHRRMNLLLAVLEKRCHKPFQFHDVFLKTAGGLRIDEPAADLAICMALLSSIDDSNSKTSTVMVGEVGLGGEIRNVNRLEERIHECRKLGIKKIVIPSNSAVKSAPDLIKIKNINELI